jgi:predicted anti-sigma-YlaC factor YlaD
MKCKRVKKLLNIYADNELENEKLKTVINSHIENCAGCKTELDKTLRVKETLSQKQSIAVSESFTVSVLDAIDNRLAQRQSLWDNVTHPFAQGVATGVAIAVTAILIFITVNIFRLEKASPVQQYLIGGVSAEEFNYVYQQENAFQIVSYNE